MFDKHYTLMVVPDSDTKSVRHIRVRFLYVKLALLFLILNLTATGILSYAYWSKQQRSKSLVDLRIKNRDLGLRVQSLSD